MYMKGAGCNYCTPVQHTTTFSIRVFNPAYLFIPPHVFLPCWPPWPPDKPFEYIYSSPYFLAFFLTPIFISPLSNLYLPSSPSDPFLPLSLSFYMQVFIIRVLFCLSAACCYPSRHLFCLSLFMPAFL